MRPRRPARSPRGWSSLRAGRSAATIRKGSPHDDGDAGPRGCLEALRSRLTSATGSRPGSGATWRRAASRRCVPSASRSRGRDLGLVGESGCGNRRSVASPPASCSRPRGPRVFRADPSWTGRSEAHHEDPDRVPGPVRVPEPSHQDRRDPGRRSDRARPRAIRESQGLCRGVARARRPDPAYVSRYPHQFSGGQRQRIAIGARARCSRTCSCATSPWPRSTCRSRRRSSTCCRGSGELGLTYLFISHDLGVVRYISDRRHHVPRPDRRTRTGRPLVRDPGTPIRRRSSPASALDHGRQRLAEFKPIAGEIPSPLAPPPGCPSTPAAPMPARAAPRRCRPSSRCADRPVACHPYTGGVESRPEEDRTHGGALGRRGRGQDRQRVAHPLSVRRQATARRAPWHGERRSPTSPRPAGRGRRGTQVP